MVTFKEIQKIFLTLFSGSIGAPIVYLVAGIIRPRGFHFFLKDDLISIMIPFIVVWVLSFIHTAIIGVILWKPLHKYNVDGALLYMLIAIVSSSLLSLFTSHNISLLGIGMSSANAIMVRIFETSVFKPAQ